MPQSGITSCAETVHVIIEVGKTVEGALGPFCDRVQKTVKIHRSSTFQETAFGQQFAAMFHDIETARLLQYMGMLVDFPILAVFEPSFSKPDGYSSVRRVIRGFRVSRLQGARVH